MIILDTNYSLIAKMGEAKVTTQPDYVVPYAIPRIRREQGTATQVDDVAISAGAMNDTTNVTLIAAPSTSEKRRTSDTFTICNRDTIAHTFYVSVLTGSTERRICNAVIVPVNYTLLYQDGSISVVANGSAATGSRLPLSGSTNGKGIKIAATSSAGDTIHTATTGTSTRDFIRLWAVNTSATDVKLTIQWGGTTATDNDIEFTVPAEDGLFDVTPPAGLILNNGLLVKAYAGTTNVIVIYGEYEVKQ